MSGNARELVSLLAAVLLHASLAVAWFVRPPRTPIPAAKFSRPSPDIEIDIAPEAPNAEMLPASPAEPVDGRPPHARATGAREPATTQRPTDDAASGAAAREASGNAVRQPEAGAPEYDPLTASDGVPGLDGAPVWTVRGAERRPTAAPAPNTAPLAPDLVDRNMAGKVLESTLRQRDHELGLEMPSAGVVASVVAEYARRAAVADGTRASFRVELDGNGRVTEVHVTSFAGGDSATWARVANTAAVDL